MAKMKTVIFFSALTASSRAQTLTPVHGCEWVPQTTAITNFTFFDGASRNSSAPAYVKWQAPAVGVACNISSPSSSGSTIAIGTPGTKVDVPCTAPASDPTTGTFLRSADDGSGSNVTLTFLVYEQCAADIYAFFYKAEFPISCATDAGGNAKCVSKGNATASVTGASYLPPISLPPPPPWHPPQRT